MELREFYEGLREGQREGTLHISSGLCGGALFGLLYAAGMEQIENCSVAMQMGEVEIEGKSRLLNWNEGAFFKTRVACTEQNGEIRWQASFWSDFEGTLERFFGWVAPSMTANENGAREYLPLVAGMFISMPELSVDSGAALEPLPIRFQAKMKAPKDPAWRRYAFLSLDALETVLGAVNRQNEFELEAPLKSAVTGLFPCTKAALLLRNGAQNEGNLSYPVISQAGIKIRLRLPELKEVDFTAPLFAQRGHWSLHTDFPEGFGVADLVNFMSSLFGVGGSASALRLPEDTALNQFKLYQIDLAARQREWNLSMEYLIMRFALERPFPLPVPYVTLEKLAVGLEVTFGRGMGNGNLVTARADGRLSVMLGGYKLTLGMEMELPERNFTARAALGKKTEGPGLAELAKSFDVALPGNWQKEPHPLGEITVWGFGNDRSFAIEAGLYDILSFSVGDLKFSLKEARAGALASTSLFQFFIQGLVEFDEGKDAFSLSVKASYSDKNWAFSGGLHRGEINIGKLLRKVFQIREPADDILSLAVTGLDISYTQKEQKLRLTAAFEAGWKIRVLGESFTLGGRILLQKTEKELDVSALAYLSFAKFKVLLQVDHMHQKDKRAFLFRLEYDKLYLQAAYAKRDGDEVLSVSLGGVTLGSLVESLVRQINPNRRYTLGAPWNLLNKIELSKFLFELNVTKKQAGFLYRADLNIAGLAYIETIGLSYDFHLPGGKLNFILDAQFPGGGGESKRYAWDALDGRPPAGKADDEKKFVLSYLGMGQHLKNDGVAAAKSVGDAVRALKEQLNQKSVFAYDAGTNWLFGADFTVNGMLNVKIVLNDPVLYGLLVTVTAKEESALGFLDGFGMELMCRRIRDDIYMFRGELLVPKRFRKFQLGVFTLTLGTIRADVYTNGGFQVDLGFPHDLDFSRSFTLEWGIFTGRGGIYFGVMKNVSAPNLPAARNGNFSPIVTLGVGLSVGLGRSFDLGVVKGGVSLEVFGIFEGVLAIFHEEGTQKESVYYYVKAVAGIVGQLYLSVDFKIITIQASARIQASAMLTMQAHKASVVEVNLELDLEASIKILFIHISFSFHFKQKASFTIGKDESAPWIEERDGAMPRLRSRAALRAFHYAALQKEEIYLSLLPLFYLERPSLEANAEPSYGVAFLMMMDEKALLQWAMLLARWLLSAFASDTVSAGQMEELLSELEDRAAYTELERFLEENVRVSYGIHWVLEEESLREQNEEAVARHVFPMLPSLTLSFGEEGREKTVNYWEEGLVGEDYFDSLTEYFKELDPNASGKNKKGAGREKNGQDIVLPVAEAFFWDYFKMFLRELAGRLSGMFGHAVSKDGVCAAAEKYGLPVAELLVQNPELVLAPKTKLAFSDIHYITREGDTLARICSFFSCDRERLWESVRHETYLLRANGVILPGERKFDNRKPQFTLEEAAVFLFVRFYEERVEPDLFYAGDIVRLNDGISMEWKEKAPGGRALRLPGYDKEYRAMRGDTPERIGKYLHLLRADKQNIEGWKAFYDDIRIRNQDAPGGIPSVITFFAPSALAGQETDFAGLADRIYPDQEEGLPDGMLFGAAILNINARIRVPRASLAIREGEPFTVGELLSSGFCAAGELEKAAWRDDCFLENQPIAIAGARAIDKEELMERVKEEAVLIGAMLSRFLLQGLSVPAPGGGGEEPVPLFDALSQMFPLGNGQADRILWARCANENCKWVETGEKSQVLSWEQIKERLPAGDFSVLPSAFETRDAFALSPQYLTLSDGAAYYRGDSAFALYSLSDAIQSVLRQGEAEPVFVDGEGRDKEAEWGCMVPVTIGKSGAAGIFEVYGANAVDRLALRRMLSLREPSVHLLYQASGVNKGGRNFLERDWKEECCMVRANLSKETRMSRAGFKSAASMNHIASLAEPEEMLMLLWTCSSVGGGGYYLWLETEDGQTLPDDIFDEEGAASLMVLLKEREPGRLREHANCCIFKETALLDNTVTLVTKDEAQKKAQPLFPAGCVGLRSQMRAPYDDGQISENEEYARSLFQVIGYRILENEHYRKSHMSAPVLPEKNGTMWQYHAVVPMYRHLSAPCAKNRENPYLCVGKPGKIALLLKDILGNTVQAGETEVTPYYNDALIGAGQYPGVKVSYALLQEGDGPLLRLMFHRAVTGRLGEEAAAYQRRAAMQLACPDISVTLDSPVSAEHFSFSSLTRDGKNYLDLLRDYADSLADAAEGERPGTVPDLWALDFPLRMEQYPLFAGVFKLETRLTVSRSKELARNEAARKTVTVVAPSAYAGTGGEEGKEEKNLLAFCRDAQKAVKNLRLAQKAEGNGILYGISFGDAGMVKKLDVTFGSYEAETAAGEKRTVRAPEFYAFAPLYHGFLSRGAKTRALNPEGAFSEEFQEIQFQDADMELWAGQMLADVEALLCAEPVKKALVSCRQELDALVEAKGWLAQSIAGQLLPLRAGGKMPDRGLKKAAEDKLGRSLTEGYHTDIMALGRLSFVTEGEETFRLTAVAPNDMEGTRAMAGKAESGKDAIAFSFTNRFRKKSIPLKTDLMFTELEYQIETGPDGYESSQWLRFAEPLPLPKADGRRYALESEIALPNPLKVCPQAPVLRGHACGIHILEEDGFANGRFCRWDYELDMEYVYREQDTFWIQIVFEDLAQVSANSMQRDLFDVLAEYILARERLWNILREAPADGREYRNAYQSFAGVVQEAAQAWEDWVFQNRREDGQDEIPAGPLSYSCMAEGIWNEKGLHMQLVSTKEGEEFLKRFGMEGTPPYIEVTDFEPDTENARLRFVMKRLPLYACAQAAPRVKIIRNQNLLSGEGFALKVREDFIYRTPEVSLSALPATGEYTQEYRVASVPGVPVTREAVGKAVAAVYDFLQLSHQDLMAEFAVSYYYGLDRGKSAPRVLLPVTLLPCGDTVSEEGTGTAFVENLVENIYQWHQETGPDTNCCGLLFQVSVCQKSSGRRLFGFAGLDVAFSE